MKRCFVAIKIPYEIKVVSLLHLLKNALFSSSINWVKPGNLHLTLAFLGEISDERIQSTIDILNEISYNFTEIDIEIKGLGTFGSAGSPTVLWIGIKKSSILNELKRSNDVACNVVTALNALITSRLL